MRQLKGISSLKSTYFHATFLLRRQMEFHCWVLCSSTWNQRSLHDRVLRPFYLYNHSAWEQILICVLFGFRIWIFALVAWDSIGNPKKKKKMVERTWFWWTEAYFTTYGNINPLLIRFHMLFPINCIKYLYKYIQIITNVREKNNEKWPWRYIQF